MYVRTIIQRAVNGKETRYLQLAENEWDGERRRARARILKSLGREDEVDRERLARLARACSAAAPVRDRALGVVLLLDGVWRALGLKRALEDLLAGQGLSLETERVLFALVANRVCAPSSKLSACDWASRHAAIDGLTSISEKRCYRAMDFLLSAERSLLRQVFLSCESLDQPEVDLFLFEACPRGIAVDDASSFCWQPPARVDGRETLVAVAVSKANMPVRIWSFPAALDDQQVIRSVRTSLADWRLSWVAWVCDRTKRFFVRDGARYIVAEKLRVGLTNAGVLMSEERYRTMGEGLEVSEVYSFTPAGSRRQIILHDRREAEATRDARRQALDQLARELASLRKHKHEHRAQAEAELLAHPVVGRCLARTIRGLVIDQEAVAQQERFDGKYVLTCSDEDVSAADLAYSYRKLREAEANWHSLKQVLNLHPVRHRKRERIHAHLLLCFLGLVLVRACETRLGEAWPGIKDELEPMHLLEFEGEWGRLARRTRSTVRQKEILRAMGIGEPPLVPVLDVGWQTPSC